MKAARDYLTTLREGLLYELRQVEAALAALEVPPCSTSSGGSASPSKPPAAGRASYIEGLKAGASARQLEIRAKVEAALATGPKRFVELAKLVGAHQPAVSKVLKGNPDRFRKAGGMRGLWALVADPAAPSRSTATTSPGSPGRRTRT